MRRNNMTPEKAQTDMLKLLTEIKQDERFGDLVNSDSLEEKTVDEIMSRDLDTRSEINSFDNPEMYLLKIRKGFSTHSIALRLYENDAFVKERYGDRPFDDVLRVLQNRINHHKKKYGRSGMFFGELSWQQKGVYEYGHCIGYNKLLSLLKLQEERIQKRLDFEKDSQSPIPVDIRQELKLYAELISTLAIFEEKLGIGTFSSQFKDDIRGIEKKEGTGMELFNSLLEKALEVTGIKIDMFAMGGIPYMKPRMLEENDFE